MPTDDTAYNEVEETEEQRRKRKERYLEQMSETMKSRTDNPFAQNIQKEKASQFVEGFLGTKKK